MTSWIEEYLTNCVLYILTQKEKAWTKSDESFYNEYLFICYVRHEKDILSNVAYVNSLQKKPLLHGEELN